MKTKNIIQALMIMIISPLVGFFLFDDFDWIDFVLFLVVGIIAIVVIEIVTRTQDLKKNSIVSKSGEFGIESQPILSDSDRKWNRQIFLLNIVKVFGILVMLITAVALIIAVYLDYSITGSLIFDIIAIPCTLLISFWLFKSIMTSRSLKK